METEITNESLEAISDMANLAKDTAKRIEEAEAVLKTLKLALDDLTCRRIPEAMKSIGMLNFSLSDGTKIFVRQEYHASIPKARKPEAIQYLRDNEFGDLIKNEVTIEFGKGEDERALELYQTLHKDEPNRPIFMEQGIHPSTLKALVKEQFESGNPLPEDLFGIHIIDRATIK